jgi:hypothetical protein
MEIRKIGALFPSIILARRAAGEVWDSRKSSWMRNSFAIVDIGKDGDLDVLGANWMGHTRPPIWIKE